MPIRSRQRSVLSLRGTQGGHSNPLQTHAQRKICFSLARGHSPLVCAGHPFSTHFAFAKFKILEDDETVTNY
jgi:hypothetical protein